MYFTRKVSIRYLDTHLQKAPGGTVAVYSVTRMFDFPPQRPSAFISNLKGRNKNVTSFLLPPLPFREAV